MPSRIPTHRPSHLPTAEQQRSAYERGKPRREDIAWYQSSRWRRVRALKLREQPLCEECLKQDRYVAANQVHHLEERKDRPELAYEPTNLQCLCVSCHSRHASFGRPTR